MERRGYKSAKQNQYINTTTTTTATSKEHPSFSSTLLDSIYRSIDENDDDTNTMKAKQISHKNSDNNSNCTSYASYSKEEDLANYRRACLIEKWMEKKKLASGEKHTIVRQKSVADFHPNWKSSAVTNLSSSSNSDSSFSGGLSSSETEYSVLAGVNSRTDNFKFQKPKPIRTNLQSEMVLNQYNHNNRHGSSNGYGLHDREVENHQRQKIKHDSYNTTNAVTKTKKLTRALKIYSDLKKAKQPISPGGRLASFINSLFASGNSKKPTNSSNSRQFQTDLQNMTTSKSPYSSNCSSASSFSRSCLSKAPKAINGAKRSVRFYPVSVIVDEDCRPIGHKSLHEEQFVEQKTREVTKNHHNSNDDFDMKFVPVASDGDDAVDEYDDDDVSCASSDLFELDNLASIGNDCYREELPVYETTSLDMNRVISRGLIV